MTQRAKLSAEMFPDPAGTLERIVCDPDREDAKQTFSLLQIQLFGRPEEFRLCIDRALVLRRRRVLSEDAFICLADYLVDYWLVAENDPELQRIEHEMAAIKRAHGLPEDDDWPDDEEPAESQALHAAWEARNRAAQLERLRDSGCADVADLREANPDELRRRSRKGSAELWTPDPKVQAERADYKREREKLSRATLRLRLILIDYKGAEGKADFHSIREMIAEDPDTLPMWMYAAGFCRRRGFMSEDSLIHLLMLLIRSPQLHRDDPDTELNRKRHIRQLRELDFPEVALMLESDPDALEQRSRTGALQLGWEYARE